MYVCKALSQLEGLSLSNNQISELKDGQFENCTNLKWLCLSNNKLKTVGSGSFRGLIKLTTLELDKNEIAEIADNSFESLTELNVLLLNNNNIKRIKRSCFEPMKDSIGLVQIYYNEMVKKSRSYYKKSLITVKFRFKIDEDLLEKKKYKSDWNDFIEQFDDDNKV